MVVLCAKLSELVDLRSSEMVKLRATNSGLRSLYLLLPDAVMCGRIATRGW